MSHSFFRIAVTVRPRRSAIKASEALLSMDIRRWFKLTVDHRRGVGRPRESAAARFLIDHHDQVGCCCRIALRAARRPPRSQAVFRTWSNSGVQRQVLPLGLPYFCPFMGPTFFCRCDGEVVIPSPPSATAIVGLRERCTVDTIALYIST